MSKLKYFLLLLAGCALATPGWIDGSKSNGAETQAATFETTVSSLSDPDPRDDTAIAVSARNNQIIVGTSKVIQGGGSSTQGNSRVAYYFSSDGGATWGNGVITLETPQKIWGRASDPSIASDLDGNFYLCMRMLDNTSFDSGVYVFKSTDGGRTFGNPAPVVVDIGNVNPTQTGKCRMTVDASPSSAFKSSIYVVWTSTGLDSFGQNSTVVRFSRRRPADPSFSVSKPIGHNGDMRGPAAAVGPNGEFYASWVGMPARTLLFNTSTDGGDTFLQGLGTIDMQLHEFVFSLEGPNAPFFVDGLTRANSFPSIDVDRSAGPNRGMVYIAWAESINRFDTDIFLIRITPRLGGLPDVSLPLRVNNDGSGVDQFFPGVSVDSSSGAVEVAFYDRRDSFNTSPPFMNVYLARSTDGGTNFGENTRVSSASSNPRIQADIFGISSAAIGIGDYLGLAAVNGKAHMMWTDTRRGKQEIFYGQLDFGSSPPPPPPPGGFAGDECQSPRVIASLPFMDSVDTRAATASSDDPVSCSGSANTNTLWYEITPVSDTTLGIDTTASDYDTVASVYTGSCGSLTAVACNDDFGNPGETANRSVLTFSATAGVRYLVEASGKGSGGLLKLRVGHPTVTSVAFTSLPSDDVLEIRGAGFLSNSTVTVQLDGENIELPKVFTLGSPLPDGTNSILYATRKKLRKLVKRGTLLVSVESPIGSGDFSNRFLFSR